ncbi:hyaluronidase-5-like [Brachionichthys hirsutus]|uniref:hyaluronidase-5-like n=1 Tax=Brachionichthys hirsutus TaxID=412623 RepID=UPI003604A891
MHNSNRQILYMFVTMLTQLWFDPGLAKPNTDHPILHEHPFLFIWNAPTELCDIRFSTPLDLSYFQFVSSTLRSATNQSLSMFYIDRFGIFPYVNEETGTIHEGGLPQTINMKEHLEKAKKDIQYYIPDNQLGFAVLDFEEWRPQWIRNWGSKDIYRKYSTELVQNNTLLSEDNAKALAKIEFDRAARRYFTESIRKGRRLRPKKFWGYYLYPDCYNYDYNQDMVAYNGECPDIEKRRNDELQWLWNESTALFPSIYLELVFKSNPRKARLYVRHRIQEAMRTSLLHNSSYSIPIYAFIRPVYKNKEDEFIPEFNLVNTIGEAAALGVSGVVSWGSLRLTKTEDTCINARQYLDQVMNPYILNVSTATRLCSKAICSGRGRCVRKQWDTDVFLHLNPQHYQIHRQHPDEPWTVTGELSQSDVSWYERHFDCMYYSWNPTRLEDESLKDCGPDRSAPRLLMILLWVVCVVLLI